MDRVTEDTEAGRGASKSFISVVIALVAGLVLGVVLTVLLTGGGSDIDVVPARVGAVSGDLDTLAVDGSNDSFDLSHATLIGCGDDLAPGVDVDLGIVEVATDDVELPPDAFLNTPEARVVLWVECISN